MAKRGEKWRTGEAMLAMTRAELAFPDAAVLKARQVLEAGLDSNDPKERRLAAERIRDERGLTRVVKPTEHAQLVVKLKLQGEELPAPAQRRVAAKVVEHRALTDEGWKAKPGA